MADRPTRRPLFAAGTLLGVGLGGFADGILFHQVLQLHHMLSARLPVVGVDAETALAHTRVNMVWDGLFHALTWLTTAVGLGLLWRAVRRPGAALSTRAFVGSLLFGWGLFNVVEGLIDHHLLHAHHVTEGPDHLVWDLLFLGSGFALMLAGAVTAGRGVRPTPAPPR